MRVSVSASLRSLYAPTCNDDDSKARVSLHTVAEYHARSCRNHVWHTLPTAYLTTSCFLALPDMWLALQAFLFIFTSRPI